MSDLAIGAAVAAALAVAVVAADGGGQVRSPGVHRPPSVAAAPPPAGARLRNVALLRRTGGTLWWVGGGCRAQELELGRLALRRLAGERCRVWPSPDGRRAITTVGDLAYLLVDRRLALLAGRPLRRYRLVVHPTGYLASGVRWSPRSDAAAFCIQGVDGPSEALVRRGRRRPALLSGRCHPAWVGNEAVWVTGGQVHARGRVLVPARTLARAVGGATGAAAITALSAASDRLAVGVARGVRYGAWIGPGAVVVVDHRGRVLATHVVPDGALPLAVGVSGDGSAGWYVDAVTGDAHLFPVDRPLPGGVPTTAHAYAWSPDGRWLAAAEGGAIEVRGWRRPGRARIAAQAARDLTWTR